MLLKVYFASLLEFSAKGNAQKINLLLKAAILLNHFQIMSKDKSLWIYFEILVTIVETDTTN